jgi:hypothetical protein
MDRFNDRVRRGREETLDQVRAGDRFRLRAPITSELGPDAREGGQRSVVVEPKPHHVFLLGLGVRLRRVLREAVEWDQASVFRALKSCGRLSIVPCRNAELKEARPIYF